MKSIIQAWTITLAVLCLSGCSEDTTGTGSGLGPNGAAGSPVGSAGVSGIGAGGTGGTAPGAGSVKLGISTTICAGLSMATFASSLADTSLGLSIAVAVAIHNIPEGISVAVLVFFATRNRAKAFAHSLASGLAEPLGALLVYLALMPFMSDMVVGGMLALVAGIMVFISFDELLPMAREYGEGHLEISGVIVGMAVMAVSLAML